MMNEELSMVEGMRKVHVLAETYQLLSLKRDEMKRNQQPVAAFDNDLFKIEKELRSYTGEEDIELIMGMVNDNIIFPQTPYEQ